MMAKKEIMNLADIYDEIYEGELNIASGLTHLLSYFFENNDKTLKGKLKELIRISNELDKKIDEIIEYINKNVVR